MTPKNIIPEYRVSTNTLNEQNTENFLVALDKATKIGTLILVPLAFLYFGYHILAAFSAGRF